MVQFSTDGIVQTDAHIRFSWCKPCWPEAHRTEIGLKD